jgi:chromosome segregation ATPase
MALNREQFEQAVRARAASRQALKELSPGLAAVITETEVIEARIVRASENVRIYAASKDPKLAEAEAELKAAQEHGAERLAALHEEAARIGPLVDAHRKTVADADVEIETTREVIAVFGEGG